MPRNYKKKPGPKKGTTNNPKGKPKGVKNKKTLQWEEFGKIAIEGSLPKVQEYLGSLNGPELYDQWLKLVEYFKPKLQRTETKDISPNRRLIVQYNEPNKNPNNTVQSDN